jgi:hypothetical protein
MTLSFEPTQKSNHREKKPITMPNATTVMWVRKPASQIIASAAPQVPPAKIRNQGENRRRAGFCPARSFCLVKYFSYPSRNRSLSFPLGKRPGLILNQAHLNDQSFPHFFLLWKGIRGGPTAPVERAHSDCGRSGSSGPHGLS